MSKTLNVGIDISLKEGVCCFLSQQGKFIGKVFKIQNNLDGFHILKNKIVSLCDSEKYNKVLIGLEASSNYGFHLLSYFSEVNIPGIEIHTYQINAKYIHRFKKSFPEKEKTDIQDAKVIAEYLRFGRLPAETKPLAPYLPLQRLVRYRYHLIKTIEREKKLYLANLFLKFPGWVQDKPVKSIGKTTLDITSDLTTDEIAQMPLEELAVKVAKSSKNRFHDPVSIAETIQKSARESYRIRPELSSSITFILASIYTTLKALKENLKIIDKAIHQQLSGFFNPLLSIPGINKVYATGILASIGDIKRFPSHNQLARMAGLVWKKKSVREI